MKKADRRRWVALGFIVLVVIVAAVAITRAHAGGGVEQQQMAVPQGATDRVWNLVSDEALTLGLVMGAGVLGAIGLVGAVRLAKRKPRRVNYGPDEGFKYQKAYDDWHHLMAMVGTYGGMVLIFALELVALEDRYGLVAQLVVALPPSLFGGFLVRPAYNYIRKKGQALGLIAKPPKGEEHPDGGDDVTRL